MKLDQLISGSEPYTPPPAAPTSGRFFRPNGCQNLEKPLEPVQLGVFRALPSSRRAHPRPLVAEISEILIRSETSKRKSGKI